ncbi:MAG: arginine--tRNA ligase [Actinomycetia bacterium]|nr:arginine--tRNA ligase [Actinomycetes bacterium]
MIRESLTAAIGSALDAMGLEPRPDVHLERPARREHGDWSTNVALASKGIHGRNPREFAADLVAQLESQNVAHVDSLEIAGPGFVNFRLADTWLFDVLVDVIDAGDTYGKPDIGAGRKVLVEFVSSNPTGPLHAGHARGAIYGDALSRLFEATGHDVTREFYINDRGVQMQNFAASLSAMRAGESVPADGYAGPYVAKWAAEMPADADPFEWGYERCLGYIDETLRRLGVTFDSWFSERSMVGGGSIEEALTDLRERGVVVEAEGALWLRSTDFGDDKDRVLVKSDGEFTYITPDIAYHRNKYARGFSLLINVFGADHHGYVTRLRAAVEALGHDPDELEVRITQMVRLERDGEEVKIGKRSGVFIELADLIDEVGADATRFTYLLQGIDSQQTVDLAAMAARSMENPVYYVQMAHARACSILRKESAEGFRRPALADADLTLLSDARELDVLRAISEMNDVMILAVRDRAPHKVITWLRELAAAFHGFFHDCYVFGNDTSPEVTTARLWLVEASRSTLASGLGIVGVSAPEEL